MFSDIIRESFQEAELFMGDMAVQLFLYWQADENDGQADDRRKWRKAWLFFIQIWIIR